MFNIKFRIILIHIFGSIRNYIIGNGFRATLMPAFLGTLFLNSPISRANTAEETVEKKLQKVVVGKKKIQLDAFPNSFNPSLGKTDQGMLLSFRYSPKPTEPWISFIGVVLLDSNLEPISQPELLHTRLWNNRTPSQSEDARLFSYKGDAYVMFNDNYDVINPSSEGRRDIFIAKITFKDGHFIVSEPQRLIHKDKYFSQTWQKNWVPFEWKDKLFIGYSIIPHEIISPEISNGVCQSLYKTRAKVNWNWGALRGGTPALLVNGEYLAFFHSSIPTISEASHNIKMLHYYMGAYTFSAKPPFQITKMTPLPIISKGFYTKSNYHLRVIFPGGYVISGSKIYLAYGKDDNEIWVATIDKDLLKEVLLPVSSTIEPKSLHKTTSPKGLNDE